MKEGARVVNTSRGGIVDEAALAEAHRGRAGWAAPRWTCSPRSRPTRARCSPIDRVVVTPHLGAATVEAQDKAGTAIAEMVRLALRGEFVPYAVNVSAGAEVSELVRPFLAAGGEARRAGHRPGRAARCSAFEAEYLGAPGRARHARPDAGARCRGSLTGVVHEPVSFVNAPDHRARARRCTCPRRASRETPDYVNLMTVRGRDRGAAMVAVAGTRGRPSASGERLVARVRLRRRHGPGALHGVLPRTRTGPGVIGTGRDAARRGRRSTSPAWRSARKAAGGLALMVPDRGQPDPRRDPAAASSATVGHRRRPRFLVAARTDGRAGPVSLSGGRARRSGRADRRRARCRFSPSTRSGWTASWSTVAGRQGPRPHPRAALRQRRVRGDPRVRDRRRARGLPPGRPHPAAVPFGAPVPHGDPVLAGGAARRRSRTRSAPTAWTSCYIRPLVYPRLRRDGPEPAGRADQRVDRRLAVGRVPGRGGAGGRRPGEDLVAGSATTTTRCRRARRPPASTSTRAWPRWRRSRPATTRRSC